MGAAREKKLRTIAKEAKDVLEAERALHQETVSMLNILRQAARLASGKIHWLESCVAEYRRNKDNGLIKDPF